MIVEDVGAWDEVGAVDYEHEAGATSVAGLADDVLDASAMYSPGSYRAAATSTAPLADGDIGSWWDDLSGIIQGGISAYRDRKSHKRSMNVPGIVPGGYGGGTSAPRSFGGGSPTWLPWAIGGAALLLVMRR